MVRIALAAGHRQRVFIELLDDPESSAWKYDEHREPIPSTASDRAALEEVLLEKPESLGDQGRLLVPKAWSESLSNFRGLRALADAP